MYNIIHLVLNWNLEILVRSKLSCVSSDSSLGTICCASDHNSHNGEATDVCL